MADDEMSQRERRAVRQRSNKGKSAAPGVDWGQRMKVWRGPAIIVLIIVAGGSAIWYLNASQPACPDHWHGTQAVFVPGGESGGYDSPHRIDWNAPKTASGLPYYNFGTDPAMSPAVHMHQSGPEAGPTDLQPAQFHFEGNRCVGIQTAFRTIDLNVDGSSISVAANTPLSSVNGAGSWTNNGNHTLHFYLQSLQDGQWTWTERNFGSYLHYQLKDGEAMLLAFGHYTDQQIHDMQAQVPAPISRVTPAPTPTPTVSVSSASSSSASTSSGSNSTSAPFP